MSVAKKSKPAVVNARETYNVTEAAERIGVSRLSLYQAIQRGELPVIRIGRRILISRTILDNMLHGTVA